MNLVRVGFLTLLLLASSALAQDTPKGYDLGECSPDEFLAAHVKFVGDDLKMDLVAPGPDVVKKFDGPVFKFTSEDKLGKHYVYQDEDKVDLELIIPSSGNGAFKASNGQIPDVLLIIRDDDGSKLSENSKKEFNSCVDLWRDAPAKMSTDKA